jgi:hypothetical protein
MLRCLRYATWGRYSLSVAEASADRRLNFFILYRSVPRVIDNNWAARVWFHPAF